MRKTGFSLIELLVVIAIIAILAALLFPLLVSARERGKTAKCVSNCRQIGSALQTYAGDWNSWIPRPAYNEWDEPPQLDQPCPYSGYESLLARYAKNWNIFYCPSMFLARIDFGTDWRKFDPWNDPDQKGDVSYAVNLGVTWPDPATTSLPSGSRAMADFPGPSSTILLAETINGWHDVWDGAERGLSPEMDAFDDLVRDRHLNRSVYLFADGHAATLAWEATHYPHNLWTISAAD